MSNGEQGEYTQLPPHGEQGEYTQYTQLPPHDEFGDLAPVAATTDLVQALPTNFPVRAMTPNASFNEVQTDDMLLMAFQFSQLALGWEQASTIDDICKMSMITFKSMEKRRDVLGYPNAYQATRESKGFVVYPAD